MPIFESTINTQPAIQPTGLLKDPDFLRATFRAGVLGRMTDTVTFHYSVAEWAARKQHSDWHTLVSRLSFPNSPTNERRPPAVWISEIMDRMPWRRPGASTVLPPQHVWLTKRAILGCSIVLYVWATPEMPSAPRIYIFSPTCKTPSSVTTRVKMMHLQTTAP